MLHAGLQDSGRRHVAGGRVLEEPAARRRAEPLDARVNYRVFVGSNKLPAPESRGPWPVFVHRPPDLYVDCVRFHIVTVGQAPARFGNPMGAGVLFVDR